MTGAVADCLHSLKRVLIVEDDRPLCAALGRVVRSWGAEAWEAHTVSEARGFLGRSPELLIADLWLESESALGLVEEAAHHRPAPIVLAISGRASPEEAFQLGQLGVRAYLPKPLFHQQLVEKAEAALREPPDLEPWVAAAVGHTSLRGLQSTTRRWMLEQAMARSAGSRSGAARLLQVTRQAIQQVYPTRADEGDAPQED